jgi:hypothetical protein
MRDVTDRIRSWSFDRGRAYQLDQISEGSLTAVLKNDDGAFEETNTSSDFYNANYNQITVNKAVRLRYWWPDTATPIYSRFYGYVQQITWQRTVGSAYGNCVLQCSDAFALLSLAQVTTSTLIPASAPGAAISAALAAMPSPFPVPKTIGTGYNGVSEQELLGKGILEYIQLVVATDGLSAIFFAEDDGSLVFQDRFYRSSVSVSATYSDDGTYFPYQAHNPVNDNGRLYTAVLVTSEGGTSWYREDTSAALAHGPRLKTIGTINSSSASEFSSAGTQAIGTLAITKDARQRVRSMVAKPVMHSDKQAAWLAWMDHDISDAITTVEGAHGIADVSRNHYIEGIAESADVSSSQWECRLQLSPVT